MKDRTNLLNEENHDFCSLVSIMDILRSENGCPWDREQTHRSIRKCLIEETYEVVEAIDTENVDLLREELGDLIFQAVFHARIEEEHGNFNIDDVINDICVKMINRHPHVFSDVNAETTAAVSANWDQIKIKEKNQNGIIDSLNSVPPFLPALIKAQKIHRKAKNKLDIGFINREEAIEFAKSRMQDSMSDAIFALAAAADFDGVDIEMELNNSISRFLKHCEGHSQQ